MILYHKIVMLEFIKLIRFSRFITRVPFGAMTLYKLYKLDKLYELS